MRLLGFSGKWTVFLGDAISINSIRIGLVTNELVPVATVVVRLEVLRHIGHLGAFALGDSGLYYQQ